MHPGLTRLLLLSKYRKPYWAWFSHVETHRLWMDGDIFPLKKTQGTHLTSPVIHTMGTNHKAHGFTGIGLHLKVRCRNFAKKKWLWFMIQKYKKCWFWVGIVLGACISVMVGYKKSTFNSRFALRQASHQ